MRLMMMRLMRLVNSVYADGLESSESESSESGHMSLFTVIFVFGWCPSLTWMTQIRWLRSESNIAQTLGVSKFNPVIIFWKKI